MAKGLKSFSAGFGYNNTSTSSFVRYFGWEGLDSTNVGTTFNDRAISLPHNAEITHMIAHVDLMRSIAINLLSIVEGSTVDTLNIPASTTGDFKSTFSQSVLEGEPVCTQLDYNGGTGTLRLAWAMIWTYEDRD